MKLNQKPTVLAICNMKPENHWAIQLTLLAMLPFIAGCINMKHEVKTEHEIKPIHITLDVNLKIDQELDNFFEDLDEDASLITLEE